MDETDDVRTIAGRIPLRLRALRARLMLEPFSLVLGVEEVECPACAGSGWLERGLLETCPVCCGFREVPQELSSWFRNGRRQLQNLQDPFAAGHVADPRITSSGRNGLLAERTWRAALDEGLRQVVFGSLL